MSLNPLHLSAGAFLALYVGLLGCAAVAGLVIPRWLQPRGRRQDLHEADALAVLAGGLPRLAEAVVTRLLASDALTMIGRGLYEPAPGATGATGAERAVLAGTLPVKWPTIEQRLMPHARTVERGLTAQGLLADAAHVARVRRLQTAPYLLLLAFGLVRLVIGLSRGRPVGYLVALLIVTAVFAVIRWRTVDRRTWNGRTTLFRARERASRLRGAPTRAEAGMAVALFGTTVLLGSGLAGFHEARAATSGDNSGGGGDGGGDGGCGGGGCGGCGG